MVALIAFCCAAAFGCVLASAAPDRVLESKEETAILQAAIQELPHDLKTAFILTVLEDYSHKECAKLLETTPKAVESRIARARKFLEESLNRKKIKRAIG